jgi:aspartyl-tRNA(Asn)/glutamyl-tRNA(Gln) amidotransferase subunit A
MSRELLTMTASGMLEQYRSRSLSPVDVARAMLRQIEDRNDAVNAFCLVDAETTLELARESEQRWLKGNLWARSTVCRWRSRTCFRRPCGRP